MDPRDGARDRGQDALVELLDQCARVAGSRDSWVLKADVEQALGITPVQFRNQLAAFSKLTRRLFHRDRPIWPMEWKKEQEQFYYRLCPEIAQWWTAARGRADAHAPAGLPVHSDEDIAGVRIDDDGTYEFTCTRCSGHPVPGAYTWMQAPELPDLQAVSGLAAEPGLGVELPNTIAQHAGRWVEYGVVEHAYATANPADFATLVERYGHTAIAPARYTAMTFLASTLGHLSRTGHVLYHGGPATDRWDYNGQISWWAVAPEPAWACRTSWADLGLGAEYVPGSVE